MCMYLGDTGELRYLRINMPGGCLPNALTEQSPPPVAGMRTRKTLWHSFAVNLIQPATLRGSLRHVALGLDRTFLPYHWLTGLLHSEGDDQPACLRRLDGCVLGPPTQGTPVPDLSLRGAGVGDRFGEMLGHSRFGLPPSLDPVSHLSFETPDGEELRIDATGRFMYHPLALTEGLEKVTERCPLLQRLYLRLPSNGSPTVVANNLMCAAEMVAHHCRWSVFSVDVGAPF